MDGRGTRKGLPEILCIGMAVLLLLFFAGEADLNRAAAPQGRTAREAAGFAAALLLSFAAIRFGKRIRAGKAAAFFGNERRNLILLAAAALLPRLAWLASVPSQVISDYGLYVRLGTEFAETGTMARDAYLLAVAPGAPVFGALLGAVMRVFGTGEGTAAAFCLTLNVCNIFLVYFIGRKLISVPGAFLTAAVFALLPENVFYSTLPSSEAPAMFLMLAGILLAVLSRERSGAAEVLLCAGGGLLLAASGCIRANAWAAVPAAGVWLMSGSGRSVSRRLLPVLALATALLPVLAGQQAFRHRIFQGEKPASGLGWALYEGLDLENGGRWTEEKSKHCIEVISACSPEEADRVFRTEALARYRSYSLGEKVRLFLRKGGALWYESRYSLISAESREDFRSLNNLANQSWWGCLAFLTACLLLRGQIRRDRRAGCLLCLIILLATTLWHEAGTSIGRYHYMLIPFALLLAGQALGRQGKEEEP